MKRLAVAIGVLGSAHYYIWQRFVAAPALPTPWRGVATAAIVLLAPGLVVAMIAGRKLTRERARPILWTAYMWFGTATYMLLGAAAAHLATAFGVSPRTAALGAAAGVAAVVIGGYLHVKRGAQVKRTRVPLAKLPSRASGYRIVQLTDVHIGHLLGRDFAEQVVARVNALEPDLIVITGDFVDGRLSELAPHVEPFKDLRAKDGVYAVTGNHEYYWNADPWMAHLGSLGIKILRNAHVTIAGAFSLAGVDDSTAGEDVRGAVSGADANLPVVLLAHHPSTLPRAIDAGVDLQLSGHTHGGQLLPLGWLSRLFEPHVAGLKRFGRTWLYVSEGTGFWGPPMRVGTTCEIAELTLVPET